MKVKVTGTVLCYNIDDDKFAKLEKLCRTYGIKLRKVLDEDLQKTVGQVVGFADLPHSSEDVANTDAEFNDEMLVLYNISGSSLDRFLRGMKSGGVDIPYKAVLTKTNCGWLPAELCRELKKEHEQMNG